ncbi:pyridoxamine 5'-phosphate oxidase family protein [Helicobacter sp. T3_23-1056]
MRRAEFKCDDMDLLKRHFDKIPFGVLIVPDLEADLPYAIPLSFCYLSDFAPNGAIGIHGAKAGRKFALLKNNPKVNFSVAKPYAYIGSEFLGGAMIPTQFFFSALVVGRFRVVEDLADKRAVLGALVAKYEPQSEHFSFSKKAFIGSERGVFVGIVEIESISIKAKFGQNLKHSEFESILSDLQTRAKSHAKNSDIDSQTIALMKQFRQNHKEAQ